MNRRATNRKSDGLSDSPLTRFRKLPVRRLGAALAIGAVGTGIGMSRAADQTAMKHGILPAATVTSSLVGADLMTGADWDIANLEHERVDYWVEHFTTDKRWLLLYTRLIHSIFLRCGWLIVHTKYPGPLRIWRESE